MSRVSGTSRTARPDAACDRLASRHRALAARAGPRRRRDAPPRVRGDEGGSVPDQEDSLTSYHTSSPDPSWDIPVDGSAFRRAAAFVDSGSTYYVWYPAAQTQYSHDLPAAGRLFLTQALPVLEPSDADWVVSYRAPTLVPPGFPAGRTIQLANGIYLVHRRS
jgi:hypothetical protein